VPLLHRVGQVAIRKLEPDTLALPLSDLDVVRGDLVAFSGLTDRLVRT
jgi:hypothetical protein